MAMCAWNISRGFILDNCGRGLRHEGCLQLAERLRRPDRHAAGSRLAPRTLRHKYRRRRKRSSWRGDRRRSQFQPPRLPRPLRRRPRSRRHLQTSAETRCAKTAESSAKASDAVKVEIQSSELCGRFTARVIRNVKIQPSPKWLKDRLEASGVASISNVVDVSNYAMLELGHPLHAFDYDKVRDHKIVVRRAKPGGAAG